MNTKTIDLRTCVPGQKLRARDGTISTYVKYYPNDYYPHTVQYPNGKYGTRSDDGSAYKHGELHSIDIVEILPMEKEDTVQTEVSDENDLVKFPFHYRFQSSCSEVRDVIADRVLALLLSEKYPKEVLAKIMYDYINSIKYNLRWMNKNGIQDMEKAIECSSHVLDELQKYEESLNE